MKAVINRCYGGFGISRAAMVHLASTPCPHMQRHEPKEYYGGGPTWENEFKEDMAREIGRILGPPLVIDGKIVTDEHRSDNRDCEHLVAAVERMGAAANGGAAKLVIVEVPDDAKWTVEEYDGFEHVAEVHRTWP